MAEIPVPPVLEPYMPMIVGIIVALLIFTVGWIAGKAVARGVAKLLRRRKIDESLTRFLASLAQWLVIAAAVIAALARVGIETASLIALLGTAGLAIGLALQGNLSHFASGVMLLLFRPFVVGDVVEAGGKTGAVDEIGLFATILITPENQKVIIPNAMITGGPIINYVVLGKRRAEVQIGVAYGADLRRVTEVLQAAAASVPEVLRDPAPEAVLLGFGASSVDFGVRIWAKPEHFALAQDRARRAIYDALAAANIEIPFNQIVVHQATG